MSETESDEMDYGVGSDDVVYFDVLLSQSDFQKEDFVVEEEESDSSSRKRPASPKKETAPSSKRAKVASETKSILLMKSLIFRKCAKESKSR